MKINIGSQNKIKVGAVKEILLDYPHLAHAEIVSMNTESDVANPAGVPHL